MGKRLAALITLRDHARRVLASQNEGWSEAHRQQARILLNRAYDRFVASFGPINKTTIATSEDGTTIRRAQPGEVQGRPRRDAGDVLSNTMTRKQARPRKPPSCIKTSGN